ncbi:MAG TPA: anhydro-N-acetylmuramic acid kinase [Burkholderiaceae bacterium]|nr:anhydro-N-acetylmuramic acid kinase [Burkholderiaceae bacterium]
MRNRSFIGLMSGTSMDSVDAVLADFAAGGSRPTTRGFVSVPLPAPLRGELMALQQPGADELARASLAGNALADVYAQAVQTLLADTGAPAGAVVALGAHGQTVRHRPELGFTVQLLNGARLAETTGIDVVCDFRSADIAAGGQGAPLAPSFHAQVFGAAAARRVIVNIGGIGNVSLMDPSGDAPVGYDTGPGNLLMDGWIERHRQLPFDDDGRWAASGRPDPALLARLHADPYFALPPPKSTGRDLFHLQWLDQRLTEHARDGGALPAPADVQATLAELTAASIAEAAERFAAAELFVCGGGARNGWLMRRLAALLPGCRVATTSALGIDPQSVEALAFAWLAARRLDDQPGNLPTVTGARGPRTLGAWHRAPRG